MLGLRRGKREIRSDTKTVLARLVATLLAIGLFSEQLSAETDSRIENLNENSTIIGNERYSIRLLETSKKENQRNN